MIQTPSKLNGNDEFTKLKALAPVFFGQPDCFSLRHDDKEEVLAIATWMIAHSPYDPNKLGRKSGRAASLNTYSQNVLKYALNVYRKLQHPSFLKSVDFDLEKIEDPTRQDPLNLSDQDSTIGKITDLTGECVVLHAPPYTVRFSDNHRLHDYWDDPYHVPIFSLKSIDVDKLAFREYESGRKRGLGKEALSTFEEATLEAHRIRYGDAIRGLIGEYLRQFGWFSLSQNQRAIISRINKGQTAAETQRELSVPSSTYFYRIQQLQARGWSYEFNVKRGFDVLVYKPLLDGKRRLTASLSMRKMMTENREELLGVLVSSLERSLYDQAFDEQVVERECGLARDRIFERFSNRELAQEYDEDLKAFIKEVVDRPSVERTRIPGTFEQPFLSLPRTRQLAILIGAIRFRRSITDMLSLVDLFADEIYGIEQEIELTWADLF